MPHKAFLHKKSLLDQFRDDHKHTGVIQSMRAEHTWNNPLTRRKRTKELNGWIKSFAGKDHIRKLSRFNAVQAHRHESILKGESAMQTDEKFKNYPHVSPYMVDTALTILKDDYGWNPITEDDVAEFIEDYWDAFVKAYANSGKGGDGPIRDGIEAVFRAEDEKATRTEYSNEFESKTNEVLVLPNPTIIYRGTSEDAKKASHYISKILADKGLGWGRVSWRGPKNGEFHYGHPEKDVYTVCLRGSNDLIKDSFAVYRDAYGNEFWNNCDASPDGWVNPANIATRDVAMESKNAEEKLGYEKGHKNSKGEDAPWVIRSHEDNRVLASFATEKEAKEHLKRMKQYSKGESSELASKEIQVRKPNGTWQRWSVTWPEYVDTHIQDAKDQGWTEVRVVDIKRNENTEEHKKSEGLSNEKVKDAVKFAATEAGLENYLNVDSDGAMSVTVSLPINSDDLKTVRWVIDSNDGTITEYLDTEKNLTRDFTDDESLVSMLTLLFQTSRMELRDWFPKKSEALFNKVDLEQPVNRYISDVFADLVVSFHWGEDGAKKLLGKYNDVILANYAEGEMSAYDTARYIDYKENNPTESKKKQESKKNEGHLELMDTIVVPKWLWDAFYFADEYGETLNDEEEEILADFKAKYADAKYHLETPAEEADFRSRNDFDNYGGPCYEINVYKWK